MHNLKKTILMISLILFCLMSYSHSVIEMKDTKKEDSISIEIKRKSTGNTIDKSANISLSINGHILLAIFNEDLGLTNIEIESILGVNIQCISALTPNGMQFYIPNAGDYIVNITLPNGDEYYGEFSVTD